MIIKYETKNSLYYVNTALNRFKRAVGVNPTSLSVPDGEWATYESVHHFRLNYKGPEYILIFDLGSDQSIRTSVVLSEELI